MCSRMPGATNAAPLCSREQRVAARFSAAEDDLHARELDTRAGLFQGGSEGGVGVMAFGTPSVL
jgi:hypothetical protein